MSDEQPTIQNCTVCDRPRAQLHARKSKLMPGQMLFLCNECLEGKREHRSIVILTARRPDGLKLARDYIVHHRYFGKKITADELV